MCCVTGIDTAVPGHVCKVADQVEGIVSIPSLPVAWKNAARLFGRRGRPDEPGPLDTRVEMEVVQDPAPVMIENVVAWLDGGALADEWVVIGAHRDAWGYGAVDNGSGTAVLLESARVLGAAAAAGWRPDRTIVFAAWDGEEWGLVGSTEWVEHLRGSLRRNGFAYLNMDSVASGPNFGASCTAGLADILRTACREESVTAPAGPAED